MIVAAGRAGTPIVRVTVMVQVEAAATCVPALSLTETENEYVPALLGVPLTVPVAGASVIPGGSEPAGTRNVYGGTPPDAVYCRGAIGTPAGTGVKTGGVIDSGVGGEFTTRPTGAVAGVTAMLPTESVAAMVNVNVPDDVGVPEMMPVAGPMDRPGGRLPVATLQV